SKFIFVWHSGAPLQRRNSPARPLIFSIALPQVGHLMSVSTGRGRASSPSRGLMYLQPSRQPEQPMNCVPFLLYLITSGLPPFGHISPVPLLRSEGMSFSAFSKASEKGAQNSSSTSPYLILPVSMSSSSSSKWLVNFRSITLGKYCTSRSVTRLPISVA